MAVRENLPAAFRQRLNQDLGVQVADTDEDGSRNLAAEREAEALKELGEDASEAEREVGKARCKEVFEKARKQRHEMSWQDYHIYISELYHRCLKPARYYNRSISYSR